MFVAIEFDNHINNTHVKGMLRIPKDFNPDWHIGFMNYLTDSYKAKNITIYPYRKRDTSDTMGINEPGFINMEDDFILALRSLRYYPDTITNKNIRIQWSKLDPSTQSFTVKER